MPGNTLSLFSHLATSLNQQYTAAVMEVIAARYLTLRLLDEYGKQTGLNTDDVQACVIKAFGALCKERGLPNDAVMQAHISFDRMAKRINAGMKGEEFRENG